MSHNEFQATIALLNSRLRYSEMALATEFYVWCVRHG